MARKPTTTIALSLFIMLCVCAAILPVLSSSIVPERSREPFPGWPETFEGLPLTQLSLNTRETSFMGKLPGKAGRFTDGEREIIIRWWNRVEPAYRLHSGADCMQCAGYEITPLGDLIDTNGMHWSSFIATSQGASLHVRERIWDREGRSWPEISAWMWAVVCCRTQGPWWCISVAERVDGSASRSGALK